LASVPITSNATSSNDSLVATDAFHFSSTHIPLLIPRYFALGAPSLSEMSGVFRVVSGEQPQFSGWHNSAVDDSGNDTVMTKNQFARRGSLHCHGETNCHKTGCPKPRLNYIGAVSPSS
jgi:hypothetical protein